MSDRTSFIICIIIIALYAALFLSNLPAWIEYRQQMTAVEAEK